MDTSHFSKPQYNISNAEPLDVNGATSNCFKIKLYGKWHFLKQLKAELRTNPRYVAAMHKEFETGYNLDHPHLVRYVACGDDYLLTEWVDGITLKEFANVNPEFFKSRANTNRLLDELLDVVQYLHSHQIVHLDLKPENILITRVGNELKLTDLGFCYTDAFTDTTGRTDSFASPEQLEDRGEVDARSDIYALGRIMDSLPCASQYRKIIARCTQSSPADRYQSVAEIRRDINKRRSKWGIIVALTAISCLIGLTAWWMIPATGNGNKTDKKPEPIDTTTAVTTVSNQPADSMAPAPINKDKNTKSLISIPTEPLSTKQEKPKNDIPATTVTTPVATPTPAAKEKPVDMKALRQELEDIARPIYNKYLKKYESWETIDGYDNEYSNDKSRYLSEVADKFFYLWNTKYKNRMLEYDYNPLAVKVMDSFLIPLDAKVQYSRKRY